MSADPHVRAAFYLSPTLDALWRWSVDGEALTWADDLTIAWRPEVEAVLHRLAPRGLPPFGAVALLLGACRDTWVTSAGRDAVAGYVRAFGGMDAVAVGGALAAPVPRLLHGRIATEFQRLLDGLDAVNRLPRELRTSVDAKALLAEAVFEDARNRSSPDDAALVARALEEGVAPELLRPRLSNEEALSQFAQEVGGLHVALARVDAESLARRAKTGLDDAVRAPDEDVSPPDRARRLLAELREDPELAGLARLAHDLMAAVSVPRTLRLREELAVGGVSDLSNRGPLDRLLVSELAHDDLTLAVRVAVNEALYLRRESPPREPPHRRAVLIDAGIRMWGVPRVFAAAVALALVATNDRRAELSVFRAADTTVEPVDLTTRKGVEAHLGALETTPHPGASLATFFERLAAAVAGERRDEPTDAILITHADALADPGFLAAVHALPQPATATATVYVAAVDRAGAFRLVALTRAGQKPVREAKLSLEAVLRPTATRAGAHDASAGVPLVAKGVELALPAILYADPFPFRLPHVADPRTAVVSKRHGLVAATDDGRVLHWPDGTHGARQVTALLPRGVVRLVHVDEISATAFVLVVRVKDRELDLVAAGLEAGTKPTVLRLPTQDASLKGAFVRGRAVCLVYGTRVDAFDVHSGRRLGSVELDPGWEWEQGRFFRGDDASVHCLTVGGGPPTFEYVPFPVGGHEIVAAFEREGVDGPHALLAYGSLITTTGLEILPPSVTREAGRFAGVSHDGHRLAFLSPGGTRQLHDLEKGTADPRGGSSHAEELLAPQIYWSTRSRVHPRAKFMGVFVDAESGLCLARRQGGFGRFDLGLTHHTVVPMLTYTEPPDPAPRDRQRRRLERSFQETRRSAAARHKMHVAAWDDGSRAWLDARGLLHLKSSDRGIPELSIVLTNTMTAAWSSDGAVSGPGFLVGDEAKSTHGAHFLVLLNRFVARLR